MSGPTKQFLAGAATMYIVLMVRFVWFGVFGQ
jgi:hypothetical protein